MISGPLHLMHHHHHWHPSAVGSSWSPWQLIDGLVGAVIGGAVTLLGLWWSFRREDDRRAKARVDEGMARLTTLANQLIFKLSAPHPERRQIRQVVEDLMIAAGSLNGIERIIGVGNNKLLHEAVQNFATAAAVWASQGEVVQSADATLARPTFVLGAIGALWLERDLDGKTLGEIEARNDDPNRTIQVWPTK